MGNAICGCKHGNDNEEFNFTPSDREKIIQQSNISSKKSLLNFEESTLISSKSISKFFKDENKDIDLLKKMWYIIVIQRAWKKYFKKIRGDVAGPLNDIKNNNNNYNRNDKIFEANESSLSLKSGSTNNFKKGSKTTTNSFIKLKRNKYVGNKLNDMKDGFGILKWEDKSKYTGYFQEDKANGIGRLRHASGFYYKGEFKDDRASGFGIFTGINGEEYYGYWENDTQNGVGKEVLPGSHIYQGEFVCGKKTGVGTYIWNNGSKYEGEWKENNIEGYGIYYFNDGKIYKGQFKNNMMNGYGEFFWRDGKKYVGYYIDDKKEGFGIHFWSSPDRAYIGFWKNGKQDGIGKYVKHNSIKYGQWVNGERMRYFDSFMDAVNALPENLIKFQFYFKLEPEKILEYLNMAEAN